MSNTNPTALNEAIAAARAGRRDEAARMLRDLVGREPFNADAWVWLAGVTSDFREQRRALEQALTIAPDNQRAQQGLNWLKQAHPEVFDGPTLTRPRSERATPSYEQRAAPQAYETVISPPEQQGGARMYETTAPSPPPARNLEATQPMEPQFAPPPARSTFDAPTQPLPVQSGPPPAPQKQGGPEPFFAPPQQTDRMPVFNNTAQPGVYQPAPPIDASRTDRMAAPPPPPATPAVERGAVARRDNRGNLSRWLLVIIWALGLGASATMAALFILDPSNFAPLVRAVTTLSGFNLELGNVSLIAFITTIALIALAVIDLIMLIGLIMRGRWAWVINLLFALLITAGTIAGLVGLSFVIPLETLLTSPLNIGLVVFTLIYLILSFTSRRAFFRRRVENYGR